MSKKKIGSNEIVLEFINHDVYCLTHNNIGSYFINFRDYSIDILPICQDYILPFLLNTVTSYILSVLGIMCLHGCSMRTDTGETIGILGISGSGKSTIAIKLVSHCLCTILSDDIVPIIIRDSIYTLFGTDVLKATSDVLYPERKYIDISNSKINGKHLIKTSSNIGNDLFLIDKIIILKNRWHCNEEGFIISPVAEKILRRVEREKTNLKNSHMS